MTAVVNNQKLFWALLSCLSGYGEFDSEGVGGVAAAAAAAANTIRPLHHHPPGVGIGVGPLGRKRTHSISEPMPLETASSKSLKLAHSPNVSKRIFSFASKPQFNVKPLAGAILFAAFEYIDHWPTPLIKAYADDCFGTRSWVDEPSCQLLVLNLAMAHNGKSCNSADSNALAKEIDEVTQRTADALIVAEFFRMNAHSPSLEDHRSIQNSPVNDRRRESMSSTASIPSFAVPALTHSRSMSMELDIPDEMASSETTAAPTDVANGIGSKEMDTPSKSAVRKGSIEDSPPKKRQRTATTPTTPPPQREEDSDSGEDDEIDLVNSGSGELARSESHGDDGSSSSSGEEDEEVVATTKSLDENRLLQNSSPKKSTSNKSSSPANSNNGHSSWDATKLSYPVLQQRLNLERVRQRYFGVNLEYAHDAISASLSERLDVKSKQNSGLLQSLPSFTSVPSIRTLIAANLEKWLQSPALSGLARSLFSKTVKSMKHVDPPLPADLQAIDNILGMRLKANQVSSLVGEEAHGDFSVASERRTHVSFCFPSPS
jgi:hypothetical protein